MVFMSYKVNKEADETCKKEGIYRQDSTLCLAANINTPVTQLLSVHHVHLISAMETMAALMKFSVVLIIVLWIFVASTHSGKL